MIVLFNLISGQIYPNYFLIRKINPDKCVNFYTPMSAVQKDIYKNVLSGIEIEEIDIDAYNFENNYRIVKEKINEYKDNELILNFTGGTKVMSSAAFLAFYEANLVSVYLDSENLKFIKLQGLSQYVEDFVYQASIDEYFKLKGQSIRQAESKNENNKDREERERFRNYMEKNYSSISDLFLSLAVKSDSAKKKWRKENFEQPDKNNNVLKYTASEKKYEIITNSGEKFVLYNDDAFYYITGGWMERQVYEKIVNSKKFHDIKLNLTVQWDIESKKKNIKNEFDIVATKNHILHIFEVKSGGLSTDIILKLFSVNNFYGGLYSKSHIVTYFDFEKDYPELLARAEELRIRIIKLNELDQFLEKEI